LSTYTPEAGFVYSHGTLAQVAAMRVHQYLDWRNTPFIFNRFLVLFLLGLWAYRVELIPRLRHRRRLLLLLFAAALACALLSGFFAEAIPRWWPATSGGLTWRNLQFWSLQPVFRWICEDLLTWSNAAAYAILLLFLISFPSWAARLKPLAAVGR